MTWPAEVHGFLPWLARESDCILRQQSILERNAPELGLNGGDIFCII